MKSSYYPYFSPSNKYWDEITEGMSDKAKSGFANALAHHMMPVFRDSRGWWMTRKDYLTEGKRNINEVLDLLDNDGKWNYRIPFKADSDE